MWYKVKELKGDGLNNSQISRELGLDRSTVSKYLSLVEDEYHNRIEQGRNLPRKLSDYLVSVHKVGGNLTLSWSV